MWVCGFTLKHPHKGYPQRRQTPILYSAPATLFVNKPFWHGFVLPKFAKGQLQSTVQRAKSGRLEDWHKVTSWTGALSRPRDRSDLKLPAREPRPMRRHEATVDVHHHLSQSGISTDIAYTQQSGSWGCTPKLNFTRGNKKYLY